MAAVWRVCSVTISRVVRALWAWASAITDCACTVLRSFWREPSEDPSQKLTTVAKPAVSAPTAMLTICITAVFAWFSVSRMRVIR